jgi:uncharacterized protein YjiS (DUF1127 family)
MSYFTTLCDLASTHYSAPSVDKPAANKENVVYQGLCGRLSRAAGRIFQRMRRDLELRQAHNQLARLNDNLLKDMGLTRESIYYILRENDRMRGPRNG